MSLNLGTWLLVFMTCSHNFIDNVMYHVGLLILIKVRGKMLVGEMGCRIYVNLKLLKKIYLKNGKC